MSGKIHPQIAVLFDHELREAAAALHELDDRARYNAATDDERWALIVSAIRLSQAALYHVRPENDAIAVIKIAPGRVRKARRGAQKKGKDADGKDSQ